MWLLKKDGEGVSTSYLKAFTGSAAPQKVSNEMCLFCSRFKGEGDVYCSSCTICDIYRALKCCYSVFQVVSLLYYTDPISKVFESPCESLCKNNSLARSTKKPLKLHHEEFRLFVSIVFIPPSGWQLSQGGFPPDAPTSQTKEAGPFLRGPTSGLSCSRAGGGRGSKWPLQRLRAMDQAHVLKS